MLKKNQLGTTGISVSMLGLGTVKFGRNQKVHYPQGFALPNDDEILNLLDCAYDLGINLLDTAPAYGSSEERLGFLLKGQRDRWVLSTKVGEEFIDGESRYDYSTAWVRKSIERSLRRLNTEYLDIVLIHSNGDDIKIINENPIFAVLEEFKKAGKIRSYGMSTKTVEGGMLAVDQSDLVMVTHNPIYNGEQEVIAHAHAKNKGVFIKKGLASGHLQKLPGACPIQTAMQFLFKEPGITSVIIGTLNPKHLQYNVESAQLALASTSAC
jgi:aryl-alcohol dehydrogenase-like predicted oxidoreductase